MTSLNCSSKNSDPSQNPHTCWLLAQASYKKTDNQASYLTEKNLENWEYLCGKNVSGFPCRLYKNRDTKELVVAIRGTNSIGNVIEDIANQLRGNPVFKGKVENLILDWEKEQNGCISTIIGHSAGGFYATSILAGRKDIHRVTFNAQKAETGVHIINLRTEKDIVSRGLSSVGN